MCLQIVAKFLCREGLSLSSFSIRGTLLINFRVELVNIVLMLEINFLSHLHNQYKVLLIYYFL